MDQSFVSSALAAAGCSWSLVPFSREGWDGEFPGGVAHTWLGDVPVSPEQVDTPDVGVSLIGLIRPVLESPAYLVRRQESLDFHRPVLGPGGEVRGHATVELSPARLKVYVSEQPAEFAAFSNIASASLLADADTADSAVMKALELSVVGLTTFDSLVVTDFDLAASLMGWGKEFFKSDAGPMPEGARWVMLRPANGKSKGVPLLVEPLCKAEWNENDHPRNPIGWFEKKDEDATLKQIESALLADAMPWRELEFSEAAWDREFPGGMVQTPIGEMKIGDSQRFKLDSKNRQRYFGLIRPTLEHPSYIVRERETEDVLSERRSSGETVYRDHVLKFIRAAVTPEGKTVGFCCVSVDRDGVEVMVSASPRKVRQLARYILNGEPAPVNFGYSASEEAESSGRRDGLSKSASCHQYSGNESIVEVETLVLGCSPAFYLGVFGNVLKKSDHGPIPPDARWITVHPNGEGTKGVPVLVQPAKDNSGTFRVIGGAGGKLNMMKLRGVKSEGEYRKQHAERAAMKRQAKKEQIRRDKELGLYDAKQEAHEQHRLQLKTGQQEFIQTVAEAMGWTQEDMAFNGDGLSEPAKKRAEARHFADLLSKAKKADAAQRQILVADIDRRLSAGLGELPLDAGMEDISVQNLDPVRIPDTSGISHDFKARAEAAGLSQSKLDEQVGEIKQAESGKAPDPQKAIERGALAQQIREELSKVQLPSLQTAIVDANKAVALIKARKKLDALEKAARQASAELQTAKTVEPKAYVLAVSPVADDAALKAIEDDLRTVRAKAFLAGVQEVGGEDAVEAHVATGAYNAVNSLAQSVGGASLVDRSVVDVLGIAATAQILARRLHTDFADQATEIAASLAQYHVEHSPEQQQQALDEAKELQAAAAEIEQGEAANAHDLMVATALNRQRKEHLASARKVIGQALGEMEANASLISAMEAGPKESIDVSLGDTALDSAVKQLWALGLTDDDYKIERVAGNVFARINASGMDKLAAPADRENLERVSRNLAIMRGEQDEDGWLPQGFAKRPDLGLNLQPGVSPSLAIPFEAKAADLGASLRDYIGSRTADGDRAADILADVQSATFFQRVGGDRVAEYRAALDATIPTKSGKKMIRVEDLAPVFDKYADEFVESRWGGKRSTLNRQTFEADAIAQDALHRALADEPTGAMAYKPVGDLSKRERSALRDWFYKNVANESPEQAGLREAAEKLANQEPERFETDMFGESTENPMWKTWKSEYDEAASKAASAGLDWNRYAHMMHGKVRAFEALQDLIRSRVSGNFAKHYNTLRPDAALKIGKTVVRNNLNHLDAIDPAEREKRLTMERQMIDSLRERIGGKYASGSVSDKIDAAKEKNAAFEQAQMGFFASDDLFGGGDAKAETPLAPDERHTIGHAAESMIDKMMGVVGKNFEPGKPIKLFNPSMSGKDGVKRQRAIKLVEQNKRVLLGAGVGSGKSAMMLGAFSHLHSQGKVKKGVICCPSIVQGQMGGEALRFLEAGKYNWHCEPGASFESRLAAYKDPETHFTVVTHQSFRDDLLKMAAMMTGDKADAIAEKMAAMSQKERAEFTKGVLDHHGISFDFASVDEGHNLLDREGKENSRMSNIIGGVTDNAEYLISATGDPVKNDASEAFSALSKMDGGRYNDRSAFMRRYGGDTQAAKVGLQRELARHLYAFSLTPDVQVARTEMPVPQSEAQQAALETVEKQAAALRIGKMTGKIDVEAARAFAPAMFAGVPEDQHEAVARNVADSVGIIKQTAIQRVLDSHPASAKLSKVADLAKQRKGQQGVVFAHSLEAVENIRKRLEADGHRVVTISGKDSSQDKAEKIRKFNPDKGDPGADIIVCSDAGATGANLQSGRWLVQYDCPQTAMTHAQRQGRIHRIGQKNAVELIDLVADHESDRRARRRLSTKYALRDLLTTPLDSLDDTGLAYYLKQNGVGVANAQAGLF